MHCVSEAMAALDMQYSAWFGPGRNPQQDAILTIAPPPEAAISGIAARQMRNGACTFTPKDSVQSSSEVSVTGPRVMTPALLTTISSPPSAAAAAAARPSA